MDDLLKNFDVSLKEVMDIRACYKTKRDIRAHSIPSVEDAAEALVSVVKPRSEHFQTVLRIFSIVYEISIEEMQEKCRSVFTIPMQCY